nr:hypothetical protein [uncultured Halomonas sp.]
MNTAFARWSRQELDFLATHYVIPEWSLRMIQRRKPGLRRTLGAIHRQARYLGLVPLRAAAIAAYREAMIDDVYDMAVLDYTGVEIAHQLSAQYGITVSSKWVIETLRKRIHPSVYRNWARRSAERRSRYVANSWVKRRRAA